MHFKPPRARRGRGQTAQVLEEKLPLSAQPEAEKEIWGAPGWARVSEAEGLTRGALQNPESLGRS